MIVVCRYPIKCCGRVYGVYLKYFAYAGENVFILECVEKIRRNKNFIRRIESTNDVLSFSKVD